MMERGGMCVGSNFVSAHGHHPRYEHSLSAHLPRHIHHPTHPILPRLFRHPSVARRPSHPHQAAPYPKSSWSLGEILLPLAAPSLTGVAPGIDRCKRGTRNLWSAFVTTFKLNNRRSSGGLTFSPSFRPPSRLVVASRWSFARSSSGFIPSALPHEVRLLLV